VRASTLRHRFAAAAWAKSREASTRLKLHGRRSPIGAGDRFCPTLQKSCPGQLMIRPSSIRRQIDQRIACRYAESIEFTGVARQDGQPVSHRGRRDDQIGQSHRPTIGRGGEPRHVARDLEIDRRHLTAESSCRAGTASFEIDAERALDPRPVGGTLTEDAGFGILGEQRAKRWRGAGACSPFPLGHDDDGLLAVARYALRLAGQRALDQLGKMGASLVDTATACLTNIGQLTRLRRKAETDQP
jgi:hypothetical protein